MYFPVVIFPVPFDSTCVDIEWRVPPNPFIALSQSVRVPTKSSDLCDMHPEHRLYMPMMEESVSHHVRSLAVGLDMVPWRARTGVSEQSLEYVCLPLSYDFVLALVMVLVPCRVVTLRVYFSH